MTSDIQEKQSVYDWGPHADGPDPSPATHMVRFPRGPRSVPPPTLMPPEYNVVGLRHVRSAATDIPTCLPTYLPTYRPTYLPTDLPIYLYTYPPAAEGAGTAAFATVASSCRDSAASASAT